LPGYPLANKLSGNVVDLCPVGALGDKDFLYRQRVWFLDPHDHVCAGCSTGCSITVEENQDRVYRLKPRENPHINHWWMCDEGRYGYHPIHSQERITQPRRRDAVGELVPLDWSQVPRELEQALGAAGRLAAVLSPNLTVEETFLLATYLRSLDPSARLALGPIPIVGQDETFKNGFTIRAEKCPNRRGVEEVLRHFADEVVMFDELANDPAFEEVAGLWISGGYREPQWIDSAFVEMNAPNVLVVQDMFASPLMDRATFQLPAAAFA
jgi:NADH-quinone oxidoreductase subunit G